MKSKTEPSMRCIGLSSDGRTNKWSVTCSCGHTFSPPTTMFSNQLIGCPRCGGWLQADFNNDTIETCTELVRK